ncbi:MAG TPA: DUF5663 domain-containing protein [Candidatus Saccharimonadales bacterium]|nr:DUF5663 domain-containing protein [Candidatus Saccharimonadales bacterium]
MLKIDNSLLEEIGLSALPDGEKNSLLRHIYETLEMRVGMRLADQMTNEQLDEFEQYFEAKDDAGAFKWLETNFPNYKEIVQEEFDKLKAEVTQSAPQILAASQQQLSAQPQAAQALPPAQPQQQPQATPYQQPVATPNPGYQPPVAPAPAQPYAAPPVSPQPPVQPWSPQGNPGAPQPPYQPDFPQQQPPAGPSAQPPQQ